MSVSLMAVPARRGFHEYRQPDGTTLTLTLAGDEFAHWYEDAEGTVYREDAEGIFVPETTTRAELRARRTAAQQRRATKDASLSPYPAPRGLLILANFSDVKFGTEHTHDVMDSLINAVNCQVNGGYGSAAQYFRDQSNGLYQPVFDVYGPVTLSKKQSYYGQNDSRGNDKYAADAVIEACKLANQQYAGLNFANYDWNNDGYVDFVYVIYAGKGEADGGAKTTIWPHNYNIQTVVQYSGSGLYSVYSISDTELDGKYLDNYAMSQEIDGQSGALTGNGTFCHEFGHVIGLPDFYDTSYGSNYTSRLTPNEWDVMDGGAYNGNGHCPPNYSAWEKYFMGWLTPENPGQYGANLTLYPNGTQKHNVYQINASGALESAVKSGLNYYIENRQKSGWDTYLPASGMLIWKVNFNASLWLSNGPNLTSNGSPHYTLAIPSGTVIGTSGGAKNVWPYGSTNSWEGVSGKPLLDITKNGNLITLTYIEDAVEPFDLTWMVNGEEFATTSSRGKVVMPATTPQSSGSGQVFVGWCRQADYASDTQAPEFVQAGDEVSEGEVLYAVFATLVGGTEQTDTYTFTSKSWTDASSSWKSDKAGFSFTNGKGVLISSGYSGAGATTVAPRYNVSKVEVKYCTSSSLTGAGSIDVTIGSKQLSQELTREGGTTLRSVVYAFDKQSDVVRLTVNCTANSIYVHSVTITAVGNVQYKDYTTVRAEEEQSAVDNVAAKQPAVFKTVRDGQVVIIRGDAVYNLLGERM